MKGMQYVLIRILRTFHIPSGQGALLVQAISQAMLTCHMAHQPDHRVKLIDRCTALAALLIIDSIHLQTYGTRLEGLLVGIVLLIMNALYPHLVRYYN